MKDFGVCLSLANLYFLNVWGVLLDKPGMYSAKLGPKWPALAGTLLPIIVFAFFLWLVLWSLRRWGGPRVLGIARWGFLGLLVIPLNLVRVYVFDFSVQGLVSFAGSIGAISLIALATILSVYVLSRWRWGLLRAVKTGLLILLPLLILSVLQVAWFMFQASRQSIFSDQPPAPTLSKTIQDGERLLWLVFDEMDQEVAFAQRPPSLKLTEFDRLRAESISLSRALPSAEETRVAMPALMGGRRIREARKSGPRELLLTYEDTGETAPWSSRNTVFAEARRLGFNSGLSGFFHPYCRIIGDCLTTCSWVGGMFWRPPVTNVDGMAETGSLASVVAYVKAMIEAQLDYLPFSRRLGFNLTDRRDRRVAVAKYEQIRQNAIQMIADPNLDLIFVHLPVPHPPGIYSRARNDFALDGDGSYLDNLVLADRTLGELRAELEDRGLWDRTTVVLTSDHPLRKDYWRSIGWWTEEDERIIGDLAHRYVPFFIKLAAQKEGISYGQEFDTVNSSHLVLKLLKRELRDSSGVIEWLRTSGKPIEQKSPDSASAVSR